MKQKPILFEDNTNRMDITTPDFCLNKVIKFAFMFCKDDTICIPATPEKVFIRNLSKTAIAVGWTWYKYEPVPNEWKRIECKEDIESITKYLREQFLFFHNESPEPGNPAYVKGFRVADIVSFRHTNPRLFPNDTFEQMHHHTSFIITPTWCYDP